MEGRLHYRPRCDKGGEVFSSENMREQGEQVAQLAYFLQLTIPAGMGFRGSSTVGNHRSKMLTTLFVPY